MHCAPQILKPVGAALEQLPASQLAVQLAPASQSATVQQLPLGMQPLPHALNPGALQTKPQVPLLQVARAFVGAVQSAATQQSLSGMQSPLQAFAVVAQRQIPPPQTRA